MFSFIKKVPVRAMRACSQIAGRSLFFYKTDKGQTREPALCRKKDAVCSGSIFYPDELHTVRRNEICLLYTSDAADE